MIPKLKLQQQFAPQNFVQNVILRDGNLPTPVPKENIIETIGRMFARLTDAPILGMASRTFGLPLSKKIFTTIGIVIFAFTVIGLIPNSVFGAGVWRRRANMPTPRWSLSTAVVNGKIYAIGGLTVNDALSTVEEYNPVTDTWTKKAGMPTPRGTLSTAVVDGKIYAIGGWDVNAFSTVEEYNPVTDTWTQKDNMPTKRFALSTTVVNGKIYAIGGVGKGNRPLATLEMYDVVTDTWTEKASMPTPRGHSASVVNGKIYAIGGGILKTVEIYDPATDAWTKGADMPTARWAHSTNVVGGKIYAIGGVTIPQRNWETVSTVEVYNPKTGRWTKRSDMPTRRGWHAASAVLGKIYVIGGASKYMPGVWDAVLLSTVEEFDTGYAINAKGKLPTLWGEIKRSR